MAQHITGSEPNLRISLNIKNGKSRWVLCIQIPLSTWICVIDSGTMLLGPLVWAASLASIIMHYMGL